MKKVIALIGSPRKQGNSELAGKEILTSLPDGWSKNMIRISDLEIGHCRACYRCLPKENECVLKDDVNWLIKEIKTADSLVIISPCYFLGETSVLKILQDRMLSISGNYMDFQGKNCVLIAPYGITGWQGVALEKLIIFAKMMNLSIVGQAAIKATHPGEILNQGNIEILHRLAEALVEEGRESKGKDENAPFYSSPNSIACPACRSGLFHIFSDRRWSCPVCGSEGKLNINDDGLVLEADFAGKNRYTLMNREAHQSELITLKESWNGNKTRAK